MPKKIPPVTPETCLDVAIQIVCMEVSKLQVKSLANDPLGRESSISLNEYIKTLISLQKENREAAKGMKLNTMTDEELEALAKEALEVLSDDKEIEDELSAKPANKNKKPKRGRS